MPELEIVSLQEAKGQGKYLAEYISFIQQIPEGEAGKLRLTEQEKPSAIRRRLKLAAKALDITLGIKRSEGDIYFWIESPDEKPKRRRGRPRMRQEDTSPPEEPVSETAEESAVAGEIA